MVSDVVWQVRQADPALVNTLVAEMGIRRVTAQVLVGRGATSVIEAQRMLAPDLLVPHSPWQLPAMHAAVERVEQALQHQELITVYGDYDVDGQTATALVVTVLRRLRGQVRLYIPSRMEEGYGLNAQAVREIAGTGSTLIITVDSGTTAVDEVNLAGSLGIDCIVTDHHEPAGPVATPFALVNPKLPNSAYPWRHLAGVGVAYKFMAALAEHLGNSNLVGDLVDLVALGTVADVVPLLDENRVLVHQGLKKMNTAPRPGLAALAAASSLVPGRIESYNLAYHMAPRLNAGGRIAHATQGVEMLLAKTMDEALPAAEQLDQENRTRQSIEEKILAEAKEQANSQSDASLLMVVGKGWHPGVIGIVASRLVEQYGRPACVLASDGEFATASARSVPGFHLAEALEKHATLLKRFGGHAMAAGFTVPVAQISTLHTALIEDVNETFSGEIPPRVVEIDGWTDLAELDSALLEELNQLGPFGCDNQAPLLGCRAVTPKYVKTLGKDGNVLRLTLPVGRSQMNAVGFRMGHLATGLDGPQDLAFWLTLNEWQGNLSLELRLRHLRPAVSGTEQVTVEHEIAVSSEHEPDGSSNSSSCMVVGDIHCITAQAYQHNLGAYVKLLKQRNMIPVIWATGSMRRSSIEEEWRDVTSTETKPIFVWSALQVPQQDIPWSLVLASPPVGPEWHALAQTLQGIKPPVEVHLLYGQDEIAAAKKRLAADWPDRDGLIQVYRVLQVLAGRQVGLTELSERTGLSEHGTQLALRIFTELGLVSSEADWTLQPRPSSKLDLKLSVSYNDAVALRQGDETFLADYLPEALFKRVLNSWIDRGTPAA